MPRRGGLGPLGHEAIERAASAMRDLERDRPQPRISETPRLRNPAATDTTQPGEMLNLPDNWVSFDSSRVVEAGYDPDAERLFVRFVKPRPQGTPWIYEGVPSNVWRNMKRTTSAGKFVNRVLNGFNYHKGDF